MVVSIHCGSRGLGHQIGTDYLKSMLAEAGRHGIALPERELACAPIESALGRRYLGAMRAAMNCAMANRQVIAHLVRETYAEIFPTADLTLLYDVSHNTCKEEDHESTATTPPVRPPQGCDPRVWSGSSGCSDSSRTVGQPVLIGGSMGTASYVLAGTTDAGRAFSSAVHGAGRAMSRHEALVTGGSRPRRRARQPGC